VGSICALYKCAGVFDIVYIHVCYLFVWFVSFLLVLC